ncbi:hypothetical protein [Mesomycoplasma hyopneumoniae]|uniref:hypothetical protein n=1 Tax=Mesomycoplasma hyopneumoniae TaxID=2099 RepID=UPI001F3877AF|nr:hypothetical protein [Mesomycoplasma hyopneumoniae]UIF67438.1 hypothetical protein KUD10_00515 [Mesomycoplasma hyopneumoniae]
MLSLTQILLNLGIKLAKNEAEIGQNLKNLAKIKHFSNKNGLDLNRGRTWFLNYIRQQKITLD